MANHGDSSAEESIATTTTKQQRDHKTTPCLAWDRKPYQECMLLPAATV